MKTNAITKPRPKHMGRMAALLMALALMVSAFAATATPAFAETVVSSEPHDGYFAKDAGVGTITIDVVQLQPTNDNMQFSSTNSDLVWDKDTEYDGAGKGAISYAPNSVGNDKKSIQSMDSYEELDIPGEAKMTWPGAATLQDGSAADVVMTISNIHLKTFGTPAKGPIAVYYPWPGSNHAYVGPLVAASSRAGMSCNISMKVTKGGEPVSGTFLFSTYDLDVVIEYNESFMVNGGDVSDIYVPSDHFLKITEGGRKFEATASDNDTYKTGFVVLADAAEGIDLTWWGAGEYMGTALFTGNISHVIDSTTTKGGSIKTTTSGKVPGSSDAGDVLEPNDTVDNGGKCHLDVPDGKDVSYLMEPEDGYELGKITVDGQEIDPDDSSTWPSFIEVTKDENGNPIVTFKENAKNHTIDVTWEPNYTIKYDANGGTGTMAEQTFAGSDTAMESKENEFTREGYNFTGFKALDEDGNPAKDENGDEYPVFSDVRDFVKYFEGKDGGSFITLQAQWEKTYTVVFEDGDHGTSEGGDETGKTYGSTPAGGNEVTPDKGWEFSGTYTYVITKDDGTTEEGSTDDPTSVTVTGNVVFTPTYNPIVTATSGEGGKITDPGDTPVENGGSKTYTFTPEPGYKPGKVTVNGEEVTPVDNGDGTWSYTLENVTEPTTIDVQFDIITPELDDTKSYGLKGNPQTGTCPLTLDSGAIPTTGAYTLVDDSGNDVTSITIEGQGTYTINPDTGEVTFTPAADFVGDPKPATIKVIDANGQSDTGFYQPHVLNDTETEEVSRTVSYVYATDGSEASADVKQTATFTRKAAGINPDTHEPIFGDWTLTDNKLTAVNSPEIDGWTPSSEAVSAFDTLTYADKDQVKDVTVVYSPSNPEGDTKTTFGGVGETQSATLEFTVETPKTEDGSDNKIEKLELLDEDGNPVEGNTLTVEGEGTYTLDPETGEVTFEPADGFTGQAKGVTVRATDSLGGTTDGTYIPTVVDNTEEKTVTKTVQHLYGDGTPVLDDERNPIVSTQTLSFSRTGKVDPDSGEITWDSWEEQTFDDVDALDKSGYSASKAKSTGESVTPDDGDKSDTIIYTLKTEEAKDPEPTDPTYWVTYVDPDGQTIYLERTTQPAGSEEPPAPANPERDGYIFDGWDRTVDADGNVTYIAKWKPVETPATDPEPAPTPAPQQNPTPASQSKPATSAATPAASAPAATPKTADTAPIGMLAILALAFAATLMTALDARRRSAYAHLASGKHVK